MGAKFTGKAERALNLALQAARELGHTYIGTEHVLLGLLGEGECIASGVLDAGGVTYDAVRALIIGAAGAGDPTEVSPSDMTPKTKKLIEDSAKESARGKSGYIGTEHLLYAILSEPDCFAYKMICAAGASPMAIKSEVSVFIGADASRRPSQSKDEIKGCPTLSKYGKDLVKAAMRGECDPVTGRETECERLMQILSRRTKNNPCLVGEPGVGKTAIVEGLAIKIADGAVPDTLKDRSLVCLDIPSMVAGAKYRGEFEDRLKNAMEEVKRNRQVILFIDEIHTIVGAGAAEGALDAANILKPALSRGEIQLIGATTPDEYRRHIEHDAALERRFQPIKVAEPTPAESVLILKSLRDKYEAHHKLKITDEAIGAAVDLSSRYLKDRRLPDKAIDLIDETASRVRIETERASPEILKIEERIKSCGAEKKEAILSEDYESAMAVRDAERDLINEYRKKVAGIELSKSRRRVSIAAEDVAKTLTSWTGIPLETLSGGEEEELSGLERALLSRIKGQDEAVRTVCRAVVRGRLGIKDPERPTAVFLFVGPSGVGKTELAKQLARALFKSEKDMIRLDMSEFSEGHSVSKLIGSPPGYVGHGEGGKLTEALRRTPYCVVLFDEIEKAHPDVLNVLLQIMEDGRLTDSAGREVDFKNAVLIMTSNVGGEKLSSPACLGFSANADEEEASRRRNADLYGELRSVFSPEFIGRIDEIVPFSKLDKSALSAIAENFLSSTASRMRRIGIEVTFDPSVAEYLVSMTDSRRHGARPLRRLVSTLVDDRLASAMLNREISRKERVFCSFDGEKLSFEKVKSQAPA